MRVFACLLIAVVSWFVGAVTGALYALCADVALFWLLGLR